MSVDLSELSPLCDLRWPPGLPRQRALHEHLRGLILRGVLRAGARLPASRVLAPTLGVARNTVLHAYAQLQAEGYLQADRHGTRVAALPVAGEARAGAPAGPGLSRRAAPALADAGHGAAELSLLPLGLGVRGL
ncbi:GntR family transcriptional regulator, partial [Sphaerotilus sulfidivorans]